VGDITDVEKGEEEYEVRRGRGEGEWVRVYRIGVNFSVVGVWETHRGFLCAII